MIDITNDPLFKRYEDLLKRETSMVLDAYSSEKDTETVTSMKVQNDTNDETKKYNFIVRQRRDIARDINNVISECSRENVVSNFDYTEYNGIEYTIVKRMAVYLIAKGLNRIHAINKDSQEEEIFMRVNENIAINPQYDEKNKIYYSYINDGDLLNITKCDDISYIRKGDFDSKYTIKED